MMLCFVFDITNIIPTELMQEIKKALGEESVVFVNVEDAFSALGRKGTIDQQKATQQEVAEYLREQCDAKAMNCAIALHWRHNGSLGFLALFAATMGHRTKRVPKIILYDELVYGPPREVVYNILSV